MTARVPLQAHLDLTPPRRRVPLQPPNPIRREGKEPVLDVIARREALVALAPAPAVAVAAGAGDVTAVQALNKAAAAQVLGGELKLDVEALFGYTPWFTSPAPWCSGLWETKQKSARSQTDNFLRMRFNAERQEWSFPNAPVSMPIPHRVFVLSHFWRGLAAPWPAYTYKVPGRRVMLKDYPPLTVGHHRV